MPGPGSGAAGSPAVTARARALRAAQEVIPAGPGVTCPAALVTRMGAMLSTAADRPQGTTAHQPQP